MSPGYAGDMSAGYVQFGVPDVPFSAVRVTSSIEDIDNGLSLAQYLRDNYLAAFPSYEAAPRSEYDSPQEGALSRPEEGVGLAPPPAASIKVYCAEHGGVEVFPSKFYNDAGDKFSHMLRPGDQYTDLKTHKRVTYHNLYWRETVDVNGRSNESQLMPGLR